MVRVIHQREKCIGCNYCVEVSPATWRMDDNDGKASLIGGKQKKEFFILITTDDNLDTNIEAMDLCPVKIIKTEKF